MIQISVRLLSKRFAGSDQRIVTGIEGEGRSATAGTCNVVFNTAAVVRRLRPA